MKLAIACKGNYISLSMEKGWSSLQPKEEQSAKVRKNMTQVFVIVFKI